MRQRQMENLPSPVVRFRVDGGAHIVQVPSIEEAIKAAAQMVYASVETQAWVREAVGLRGFATYTYGFAVVTITDMES